VIIVLQDVFIYKQFYSSFFVLIKKKIEFLSNTGTDPHENETGYKKMNSMVVDAESLKAQLRVRKIVIWAMFIFVYWIYMLFVNNFFHSAYLSDTANQGSSNWIEFMYNLHTRLF
jgi:hypothetical protein